ncbi:hypothetical protein HK104_004608 [Borealophlyctis nickersoniae]|nr:hypothetical protein HK104_004608 [Borealophlyctis nickersoniae]
MSSPDSEQDTPPQDLEAQINKYESFVTDRLRPHLLATLKKRDEIYNVISEYLKLKSQIQLLQSRPNNTDLSRDLKTLVDIGCQFYVQARIPDATKIILNMGCNNLHVELTLDEAVAFIEKKERVLLKQAEKHTETAAKIKAHIKIVLETIQQLLDLNVPETERFREP